MKQKRSQISSLKQGNIWAFSDKKQTMKIRLLYQEIPDPEGRPYFIHSKKSTERQAVCPDSPPVMTLQPGSSWGSEYESQGLPAGKFRQKSTRFKLLRWGQAFWEFSPPLPIIYCYTVVSRGSSAGTCTSNRERLTGCSQRENSTPLSFSLFCQFIKVWASRPRRKISHFFLLLLRLGQDSLFALLFMFM